MRICMSDQLTRKIVTILLRNMGRNVAKTKRKVGLQKRKPITVQRRRSSRLASLQTTKLVALQSGGRRSSGRKLSTMNKSKDKAAATSSTTSASKKLRTKELNLQKQGYKIIAGVDEAGRGPLCGPVVAACCHIPTNINKPFVEKIADSKTLNEKEREQLYEEITSHPKIFWGVGMADNVEIDKVNILQATMLSMHRAIENMKIKADYILIDGNRAPYGHEEAVRPNGTIRAADPPMPQHIKMVEPVIKGDAKVFCIAAASILAKVTRDRIMEKYDRQYPMYNIKDNKGYPTAEHQRAVHSYGPSPIHRMTFAPLKHMNFSKTNPTRKKQSNNASKTSKRGRSINKGKGKRKK